MSKAIMNRAGWVVTLMLAAGCAENALPGGGPSQDSRMTLTRSEHAAVLLPSGQVLVSGGVASGDLSSTWSTARPMTEPRSGHTATLLPSGEVLLAGGDNGERSLGTSELYTP